MQSMRLMRNSEHNLTQVMAETTLITTLMDTGLTMEGLTETTLYESPVIIEESNEIITSFLSKNEMERGNEDAIFLQNLVAREQAAPAHDNNSSSDSSEPVAEEENNKTEPVSEVENFTDENAVGQNNDKFIWTDKAILLLIELYREKEEVFSSGCKRSNKIWAEIAAEINKINPTMSGLKRTYKSIIDMNKKSGNNKNSWAFFSVMDSLFGDKASIRPLAIATNDGPSDPNLEGMPFSHPKTSSSDIPSAKLKSPPKKRRRVENIMEEFLDNVAKEKEERREEMRRREANRKKILGERRKERDRKHNEQISFNIATIS